MEIPAIREAKSLDWDFPRPSRLLASLIDLCKALHKSFKEARHLLGMGNCQSNDFDAQIADTTITLIWHILLTLRYRFDHYESMGSLFTGIKEGIISHRLNERIWGLFIELLKLIETVFIEIDEEQLLERIINDDKVYEKLAIILDPSDKKMAT